MSITPAYMTDTPYSEDLISRYNRFAFSYLTERNAARENDAFAEGMKRIETEVDARLERYGATTRPERVVSAINNLRRAEVDMMYRWVRARELAPGAYVVGPSNYLKYARPEKADKCIRIGLEDLEAAKARLERAVNACSPRWAGRISSDDPDAVAKLADKIAELERLQELMKVANAIVRRKADKGATEEETLNTKIALLLGIGVSEENASKLLIKTEWYTGHGFPSFELTNNGAEIRRLRERMILLSQRQSQPTREAMLGDIRLLDNVDDNRFQVFFPGKPCEDVREKLKSHGFKWAPSVGAWQRMRSNGAAHWGIIAIGGDPNVIKWEEAEANQATSEQGNEESEPLPTTPNSEL